MDNMQQKPNLMDLLYKAALKFMMGGGQAPAPTPTPSMTPTPPPSPSLPAGNFQGQGNHRQLREGAEQELERMMRGNYTGR